MNALTRQNTHAKNRLSETLASMGFLCYSRGVGIIPIEFVIQSVGHREAFQRLTSKRPNYPGWVCNLTNLQLYMMVFQIEKTKASRLGL